MVRPPNSHSEILEQDETGVTRRSLLVGTLATLLLAPSGSATGREAPKPPSELRKRLPRPNLELLPGGIKPGRNKALPRKRPVGPSVAQHIENMNPELAGKFLWKRIQEFKSYGLKNNYSMLKSEPPNPNNPNQPVHSNPLLEVLVEAAHYCERHKLDSAAELFDYKSATNDKMERRFVGAMIDYLATDIYWHHTSNEPFGKRSQAATDLYDTGDISNRYIYAHALGVPKYGIFNTSLIARSVLDYKDGFPENIAIIAVLVADGILMNSQRRTPEVRELIAEQFAHDPRSNAELAIRLGVMASKSPRQPDATRRYIDELRDHFKAWTHSQQGRSIGDVTSFAEYLNNTAGGDEYLIGNDNVARGLAAVSNNADEIKLPGKLLEYGKQFD